MRYSYRNNVGENRVLPFVCNAHDFHHIKSYVNKQTVSSKRASNERPYGFAKQKKYKKTPTLLGGHFICWHLPIFPGRHQPSIFGTTELNFCVRYGNRWTLSVINTNYSFVFISLSAFLPFGDSCGNRTRVAGVRGRSLNRLTNEPCLSSQRLMVFALISPCNFSWCTIRGSNPGHPD